MNEESGGEPRESSEVTVQFVPVGRSRREWMWKARDDSNTITISGRRFESLGEAMRDARTQIDGLEPRCDDDTDPTEGPFAT
jgi:hypothetical protein